MGAEKARELTKDAAVANSHRAKGRAETRKNNADNINEAVKEVNSMWINC